MRAFITGATGFIGSNLARALVERGVEVRVLRRPSSRLEALADLPVEYVSGDVLEPETLTAAMRGCDVVFHAAAMAQYWRNGAQAVYRVNVEGTRNVVQAALAAGVGRVVHTSSVAALGCPQRGGLMDETHQFPSHLSWFTYGHSKYLAEQEVLAAVERNLDAVIVNPGMVLGPGDLNFVSGSAVRASLKGQLRLVPPGGSNLVHVADVVAGHLAAAERGRTGERYILGGENLSHWQAAQILAEVTGGPRPVAQVPAWLLPLLARLVDVFNRLSRKPPLVSGEQIRLGAETFYVDCRKAVRELGLPQTPFRRAAADAFAWYRQHGLL